MHSVGKDWSVLEGRLTVLRPTVLQTVRLQHNFHGQPCCFLACPQEELAKRGLADSSIKKWNPLQGKKPLVDKLQVGTWGTWDTCHFQVAVSTGQSWCCGRLGMALKARASISHATACVALLLYSVLAVQSPVVAPTNKPHIHLDFPNSASSNSTASALSGVTRR